MKEFFDFMVKYLSDRKEKFVDLKKELEKDPDLLKKEMKVNDPLVYSIYPIKKTIKEASEVTFEKLKEEAVERQRLGRMVTKIVEG